MAKYAPKWINSSCCYAVIVDGPAVVATEAGGNADEDNEEALQAAANAALAAADALPVIPLPPCPTCSVRLVRNRGSGERVVLGTLGATLLTEYGDLSTPHTCARQRYVPPQW